MEILIAFVLGSIFGGVALFFVYRNNQKKFDAVIDLLKRELEDLKDKVDKLK